MPVVDEGANPIVITGPITSTEIVTKENISIQKVLWSGATTAGHKMNLTDLTGRLILPMVADAPGSSGILMYTFDMPVNPHPCKGLVCDDLDSGQILVYWTERSPSQEELLATRLG